MQKLFKSYSQIEKAIAMLMKIKRRLKVIEWMDESGVVKSDTSEI